MSNFTTQFRGGSHSLRENDAFVGIRVEGLKELEAQLLELGAVAGSKALVQAARNAFLPVLIRAKALVPVDTGQLRDSIRLTVKRPKTGDAVVVVGLKIAVGKGGSKSDLKKLTGKHRKAAHRNSAHWRWHFIEFGTSKMPAHPFLRPAFAANQTAILETLKTELAKEIERAWKKKARAAGFKAK